MPARLARNGILESFLGFCTDAEVTLYFLTDIVYVKQYLEFWFGFVFYTLAGHWLYFDSLSHTTSIQFQG